MEKTSRIFMYGQGDIWRYIPGRQLACSSARNWSRAEETLIEVYEVRLPPGPARMAVCMALNGVVFERRRWSAYRQGRVIPAWREEWTT